jgi:predicted secreted protein
MTWMMIAALFFIVWWMVLLISLPFVLHTANDNEARSPMTGSGVPGGRRVLLVLCTTTLLALILVGGVTIANKVYGVGFDVLPRMIPD